MNTATKSLSAVGSSWTVPIRTETAQEKKLNLKAVKFLYRPRVEGLKCTVTKIECSRTEVLKSSGK
jgi:hypothetical protein